MPYRTRPNKRVVRPTVPNACSTVTNAIPAVHVASQSINRSIVRSVKDATANSVPRRLCGSGGGGAAFTDVCTQRAREFDSKLAQFPVVPASRDKVKGH